MISRPPMTLGNMRERCLGKPAQNALAAVCGPCELMTIAAFIELASDLTSQSSSLSAGGGAVVSQLRLAACPSGFEHHMGKA